MNTITVTNAQGRSVSVEYDWEQGRFAGCTVFSAAGSPLFIRTQTRAPRRPTLVTAVTNAGVQPLTSNLSPLTFSYAYDAVGRPVVRDSDAFAYNARGEVANATIDSAAWNYAYDYIGNRTSAAGSAGTTAYAANSVNQYTAVGTDEPEYDTDGNLVAFGNCTNTWNAAGRLAASETPDHRYVFEYDNHGRRVRRIEFQRVGGMWQPVETRDFVYDDWNLIHETRTTASSGAATDIDFFWGPDLSDSLQGAGGVGGLVAISIGGDFYFPGYDNNGNVVGYWNEDGEIVAEYAYDVFGNTIAASGSMASVFPHRFSTKSYDSETDLYYYGYRYYSPNLGRWVSRDLIEENGGKNLFSFCQNDAISSFDFLGFRGVAFYKPGSGKSKIVSESDIPWNRADIRTGQAGVFLDVEPSQLRSPTRYKVEFSFWGKICEIQFRVGIWIDEDVVDKTDHAKGELFGYYKHRVGKSEMVDNMSHNPIFPSTLTHERGHAKAYWEVLKPLLESGLAKYFDNTYYWKNSSRDTISRRISSDIAALHMNAAYIAKSVQYSNEGTINYYQGNDNYEVVRPAYIPPVKSTDGLVDIEKEKKLDYLWRRR